MRLSEEEYDALVARRGPVALPLLKEARIVKQSRRGQKNKTETRFENDYLRPWLTIGQIKEYAFEDTTLRLANGFRYTPDFRTVASDGKTTVFYEIKGAFIRDKGTATVKVAAAQFPFYKFILCQWTKGEWLQQEIRA